MAGTFGFFLLLGGCPRRFSPELEDPAAPEEVDGSMAQGRCLGKRAVLEEASEVLRASRKKHLKAQPGSKHQVPEHLHASMLNFSPLMLYDISLLSADV
jgi:hypothetical protein